MTLIGNEGFRIVSGSLHIFIDAFYGAIAGVAERPCLDPKAVTRADLILVTHPHWDHFDARSVVETALRIHAVVVGPKAVTQSLRGKLSPYSLIEMEPAVTPPGQRAASRKTELPGAVVTAFRTCHDRGHNSYLVEIPGSCLAPDRFRFFHDGDNENTRLIEPSALGRLDALLIGPWQGSGWVDFIETLSPKRYFLMHLTAEELDQHEQNRFLPELCDRVPEGLVVLRPGQSYVFE